MATGRLGAYSLSGGVLASVYTVPSNNYSVVNVSFCNTQASAVTIRLAIATSGSPLANEYIEYDTTVVAKGVFERTGLVLDGNKQVVCYTNTSTATSGTGTIGSCVNVMVYGIETSTT
jgi:hypothetical protein